MKVFNLAFTVIFFMKLPKDTKMMLEDRTYKKGGKNGITLAKINERCGIVSMQTTYSLSLFNDINLLMC